MLSQVRQVVLTVTGLAHALAVQHSLPDRASLIYSEKLENVESGDESASDIGSEDERSGLRLLSDYLSDGLEENLLACEAGISRSTGSRT